MFIASRTSPLWREAMIFGHDKTQRPELVARGGLVTVAIRGGARRGTFGQGVREMDRSANSNDREEKGGGKDKLFHDLSVSNCVLKYVYLLNVF
jgi:hypothetical protein